MFEKGYTMFEKDYTIRIFYEAAPIIYLSCDFCKFNSWKKCWGIRCKIIKDLEKLGFNTKNFGCNNYICRVPHRPNFNVRDTLKQIEDKYDTLHGDVLKKNGSVILDHKEHIK